MAHSFIYTSLDEALSTAHGHITHLLDLVHVTNEVFCPAKKDNKTLSVDAVREMIKSAYLAPLGETKAFIFPNADTMLHNSQNALLKLIEEPPPNVLFFFVADNPKLLLATILSRSQIVYSDRKIEDNSEIYSSLLPLAQNFAQNQSAKNRYALEFALTNLKDNKQSALQALENIFSFTNEEIADNIIKAKVQKRICRAYQQVKQNCNWQAVCWQLIKN